MWFSLFLLFLEIWLCLGTSLSLVVETNFYFKQQFLGIQLLPKFILRGDVRVIRDFLINSSFLKLNFRHLIINSFINYYDATQVRPFQGFDLLYKDDLSLQNLINLLLIIEISLFSHKKCLICRSGNSNLHSFCFSISMVGVCMQVILVRYGVDLSST